MKFTKQITDEDFLAEVGGRLTQLRLENNLTQSQLANQSGVSKRTLERMESGSVATQLSSFIRICRALNILERFNDLIPEQSESPIQQLKLQKKKRRRASSKASSKRTDPTWEWGEGS